jgi:hypothetical protein
MLDPSLPGFRQPAWRIVCGVWQTDAVFPLRGTDDACQPLASIYFASDAPALFSEIGLTDPFSFSVHKDRAQNFGVLHLQIASICC